LASFILFCQNLSSLLLAAAPSCPTAADLFLQNKGKRQIAIDLWPR
jgi:hypothetical protein